METGYAGTSLPGSLVSHGTGSKAVAFVAGMALAGSGSIYKAENLEAWASLVQGRVPFVVRVSDHPAGYSSNFQADVRTPAQHMANIRQVLKPSVPILSSFFGLSRQAIYKWISGASVPEADNLRRIEMLSLVADEFRQSMIKHPDTLLLIKAFDGRSLLDLIQNGTNRPEHVQALVREARIQEAAYQRSGLAHSKAPATDDWRATISIPGGPEQV